MKITTNADAVNKAVQLTSLFAVKAADLKQRMKRDENDKEIPSLTADGRATYRTSLKALHLDENGNPDREERDVTIALTNTQDIPAFVPLVFVGDVTVTHYLKGEGAAKSLAVSIVADGVAPLAAKVEHRKNEG